MHSVWARAKEGQHSALVGPTPTDPGDGRVVVRVDCEGPWSTFGPLEDARRRIEQLLGDASPLWDEALDRMGTSVLTRFLGDVEDPTIEATLVAAANRLAANTDGAAVLVFESVDRADLATLQGLEHVLSREGWLELPVVLQLRERTSTVTPLLDALAKAAGGDAIVQGSETDDVRDEPPKFEWTSLSPEVLRVLRAASVVGRTFEAPLVAALLDESPTRVLELLQRAADDGAPVADRGAGRFFLPEGATALLQVRLLPSLLEHYNLRLAELLSPRRDRPTIGIAIPPSDETHSPKAEPSVQYRDVLADAEPRPPGTRGPRHPTGSVPIVPDTKIPIKIDPAPSRPDAPPSHPAQPSTRDTEHPPERPRSRHDRSGRQRADAPPPAPSDDARAAKHFSAGGNPEAAVDRYVEAIRKVDARGDSGRALLLAEEALALLQQLPGSPRRAILRARILAEAGRVQWRGSGVGPALTLQGALGTLEAALAALRGDAPRELRTELASLIAGVCYDLGDTKSLERALQELTVASEAHLKAGQSEKAARLLNDQAAVYLRAGDPVRATHLLDRSREIFDSLHRTRPDDPIVIRERAETEHLLARLPLHAKLRKGREDDAFSLALGHARAAAEAYDRLRSPRDIARVWETMGRLEIRRERLEPAGQHLLRALDMQRNAGDAVGLARTTAALAELYLADGRADDAVAVLGDSIELNYEKGSPIGLAYNRRAIARLRDTIGDSPGAEVLDKLERAESVLGQVSLPPEPDA